ncbi:AAA family ATPase [Cystobacter fuscus]|uniref:trifunctional serine/threonine-protein kinase/ATP-binding protein/sensor histidine kinase n=1 Tax=Cystobacter fuscus TaxID=43 RepID=UPI002B283890|nr:AAA family ATPase [Cystobacter fuscus]
MDHVPGFEFIERLHEGKNSLVSRTRRQRDGQLVVLKMLSEEYPSPERCAWFRREYETTRSMGDLEGIIQTFELHNEQQRWFMELEDFGGSSLARLMRQRRFTGDEILRIASTAVSILAKLQERHVIHKDINPSNLVLNPETGLLKLIDFGISSVLSCENTTLKDPSRLEGTLAYISPEQTGRMNRAIDYRTDFYSLGVTLYELSTGQLPFQSMDPLELVHAHLAREPVPPHELEPSIDPMLSAVIMRLLAKNAEDRYQSSYGLLHDLEECKRRRVENVTGPFVVAREDTTDRFQIPQKLYGREQQTRHLLEAFERVAAGAMEMMLISGYSGIGKSALVREIYRPITRQRGYIISGKFDQLVRDEPYAPLLQAFRGLIRQILSENSEGLKRWRGLLTEALGPNGRMLTDVMPDLEAIIGPQPTMPDMEPVEARNRFHLAFQSFIKVFARREHPLAIFIDDLQWVDSPSLALIQSLMTDEASQYLFLIGAYRDNEVNETHPLTLSLAQLRKSKVVIRALSLQPLGVEHVEELIRDAFARGIRDKLPLARLAHSKTGGNPFFLGEFLKHLYAEKLVRYDLQGGWQWSLEQIAARNETDNVVVFMAGKVQKLAPESRRALQLAACTGNVFALRTLAVISERSPAETAASLWEALDEGLIQPLDDAYKLTGVNVQNLLDTVNVEYRFTHDRIQQAAYSLIADEERRDIHWRVGKLLWANTPAETLLQRVFDIVYQLDHSLEYAQDRVERDELARLHLLAGRKAKASAAYEQALRYLRIGLQLLGAPGAAADGTASAEELRESWTRQYRLCLELHDEAAEAAYLCGEYEEMQRRIQVVLEHARTLLDKVRSYKTEIQSFTSRKELLAGVDAGCRALAQLGIHIPPSATMEDCAPIAAAAAAAWAGRNIEDFISRPEMTDPEKLAAMELLARLYIPAYNAAPVVYMLVAYHKVILSLTHGLTWSSPRGMSAYAFLLCVQGDIESGYRFGWLALRMAERFRGTDLASTYFMFNFFVRYWRESAREPEPFLDGYRHGLEAGDQEFAALNLSAALSQPFWSGAELPQLAIDGLSYDRSLRHLKQEFSREIAGIHLQGIHNLLGRTTEPLMLAGDVYDERERLPQNIESNNVVALGIFHLMKLALCCVMGENEKALAHSRKAEKYMGAITIAVLMMAFRFYDALASLACCDDARQEDLLARVEANLERLRTWSKHAPGNLAQKVALVEAERARVLGHHAEARELYDQAITLAQKHRFIWDQALAHELAARFYRERGQVHMARLYLRDAHYAYQRWGAAAKVAQLEASFRHELAHARAATADSFAAQGTTQEYTIAGTLDLRTVLKASQALSGELALDKLLTRLLTTVLENAGAQKALLILEKNGELVIEAEGSVDGPRMRVLHSIPISSCDDLLPAIVHLVARSGKPEVVNDASAEGMFTHEVYVQRMRVKSLLCMPLINQGKLTALLYLENNLVSGAFTHERIELLNLLSGEMAIAIDHARLYRALEVANKELSIYSQTLEEKVSARTRELEQKNAELQGALKELKSTQAQLIQQEKLASLGHLTAGVAHEIKNPLNFVNNFAQHTSGLLEELRQEARANPHLKVAEVEDLLSDLGTSAEKIYEHGQRADGIVRSMMEHSRTSRGERRPTPMNALVEQYVNLVYEGTVVSMPSFTCALVRDYDPALAEVDLVPQEIGRVLINLLNNAFYAVNERRKHAQDLAPQVTVRTRNLGNMVELRVEDNGPGIPEHVRQRMFEPFFTTKPTGQGTGLGLSLSYDIITNGYGGTLEEQGREGKGAAFVVRLSTRNLGDARQVAES